jgi:hypothetical protein
MVVGIIQEDVAALMVRNSLFSMMRTSTPIIHPRRPRRHLLVLLPVLVLEHLIIK